MPSIQILYDSKDHAYRGELLKNTLVNEALAGTENTQPVKIVGLTTLIFWGHGDQDALCNKTSDEVVRIIRNWKGLNADLQTVEILTCNSSHFKDSLDKQKVYLKSFLAHLGKDKKINNSMAKQIKRGLKYSFRSELKRITVKAMPQSGRGSYNNFSILLWDKPTSSWCYVTGPTEPEMGKVRSNIQYTKKFPPDPNSRYDEARVGDFPTRLAAAKRDFPQEDYTDVKAGFLG